MALIRETKRLLYYSDLLIANFWRYLVQSLWLFFPPIIFIFAAYFAFWHITQGKDLMVIALEHDEGISYVFGCFILAMIFWVYVTWYSTRLVAMAKDFQDHDHHHIWKAFQVQTPRILAFTCISIILLAFFQLDIPGSPDLPSFWCHILLILSFPWYFGINRFWEWALRRRQRSNKDWLVYLNRFRLFTYLILAAWVIAAISVTSMDKPLLSFWTLISLLISLQLGLVLLLIIRREIGEAKENKTVSMTPLTVTPKSPTWKKIKYLLLKGDERIYLRGFNIVSGLAFIIYVAAIFSVRVSVTISSFPFMLLAFGVLLGIGNFITLISVFARFNFHLVFFIVALIIGQFIDPHYATIVTKEQNTARFDNRQTLKEYFINWLNHPDRKTDVDTAREYPLYFVLANGGASRSGYWTAGILGGLEDISNGKFSRHLFCLSGASGGSVGTSTFFSLLRAKDKAIQKFGPEAPMSSAGTEFLKTDFLTYTLAHMLGPDVIRHTIPLNFIDDRSAALAHSIEKAADTSNILYDSFSVRLSSLITQKDQPYSLPVICINTTRMQDGSPAVISNIDMTSRYFNQRVDLLSLLNNKQDMKLSTAVVLGASFPYVSPAGRIDSRCDTCDNTTSHYFVDGGYFDNSGAGVVNEMLIAMADMLENDTSFAKYRDKLVFNVIHITNTEPKKLNFGKINPMTNDLLAPVKTLLGSYGTQTTINDQRLKNFLSTLYKGDDSHYTNIDLYEEEAPMKYSMNWVISKRQLSAMGEAARGRKGFWKEVKRMEAMGR